MNSPVTVNSSRFARTEMKGMPLFIKILASVILFFVAIVVAGTSGLAFYVWPTGIQDKELTVTPEVIQRLRNLQREHKFGPDSRTYYPGAMSEELRVAAQASVDSTIQSLITELPKRSRRSTVLRTLKVALAEFPVSESEERDQMISYLQKVMGICGVESSSELFNVWRYGFPYGWFL